MWTIKTVIQHLISAVYNFMLFQRFLQCFTPTHLTFKSKYTPPVTRPSHWKGEKNELLNSNSMGFGKELVAFVMGGENQ